MQKKQSLISVVMAAYNEEKYIPRTLESLKKQTYHPFPIYVVDNSSTDRTGAIARSLGAEVLVEKEQGYVHALNTGLKHASSDIIAITDADTVLPPDWLEKIIAYFSDPAVVALTGPSIFHKEFGIQGKILSNIYTLFCMANFAIGKPHITGTGFAIRKETFDVLGGLDKRYEISADVELGLRMKRLGKVLYAGDISVFTSMRRWKKNKSHTLTKNAQAYFDAVWLNKPPKGKLKVIR